MESHTESQTAPHPVESLTASHSASNSVGCQLTGGSRDISATESSRTNSHSITANHGACDVQCSVSATSVPLHPIPVYQTNQDLTKLTSPDTGPEHPSEMCCQPLRPMDGSTDGCIDQLYQENTP